MKMFNIMNFIIHLVKRANSNEMNAQIAGKKENKSNKSELFSVIEQLFKGFFFWKVFLWASQAFNG